MALTLLENRGFIPLPADLHEIAGWKPGSSAQLTALQCRAQFLLYGGTSGSMKTNYLVADSAQEYDNGHFRGVLLRKSYTEMTNIIDEMEKIYSPLGGRKSDGGKIWRFPSGAVMRLGYLAKDADVELYTGKPISWLGIDEAQFQTEDRVKRADATCFTELRRRSPFASGLKRSSSSPPSPVLDLPPMRFMAMARVSCASLLIEPNDIAPVVKRFTISLAGSTSSIGIGLVTFFNFIKLRSVARLLL